MLDIVLDILDEISKDIQHNNRRIQWGKKEGLDIEKFVIKVALLESIKSSILAKLNKYMGWE